MRLPTILGILLLNVVAQRYRQIVARRIKAIQEKMWDPQTRFFYSLQRDSHAKIPVRTIQGFLTLTCGAPSITVRRPSGGATGR
jgi:hypothetical protein